MWLKVSLTIKGIWSVFLLYKHCDQTLYVCVWRRQVGGLYLPTFVEWQLAGQPLGVKLFPLSLVSVTVVVLLPFIISSRVCSDWNNLRRGFNLYLPDCSLRVLISPDLPLSRFIKADLELLYFCWFSVVRLGSAKLTSTHLLLRERRCYSACLLLCLIPCRFFSLAVQSASELWPKTTRTCTLTHNNSPKYAQAPLRPSHKTCACAYTCIGTSLDWSSTFTCIHN